MKTLFYTIAYDCIKADVFKLNLKRVIITILLPSYTPKRRHLRLISNYDLIKLMVSLILYDRKPGLK